MKIGVRVHDFGKSNPKRLAELAKEVGFSGVQLVLNKAIEHETGLPGTLSLEKAEAISQAFSEQGLSIYMLGAYFNPVHSNSDLVLTNIAKFKEHLQYASAFKAGYVGSETGSYNDDKWTYHPMNRTEEAYLRVKTVFNELAVYAKTVGAKIALEGAYGHCMYEPSLLKRLVDEIDNGTVFVTVDLYNYLSSDNYLRYKEIFEDCLECFKGKIVIFHLKDCVVENGVLKQVAIGKGMFDYDYLLGRIQATNPDAVLIFEGSKPEDMKESFDFIQSKIQKENI